MSETHRVLLVDDEETLLTLIGELLSDYGYEVTKCADGKAALALFQAAPDKFDLVITDQTMPKLTGVELAKKLLAIRPDIPIILSTGYSKLVNEAQAKAIGIHNYLRKPIDPNQLLRVVNEVLSEVA